MIKKDSGDIFAIQIAGCESKVMGEAPNFVKVLVLT